MMRTTSGDDGDDVDDVQVGDDVADEHDSYAIDDGCDDGHIDVDNGWDQDGYDDFGDSRDENEAAGVGEYAFIVTAC